MTDDRLRPCGCPASGFCRHYFTHTRGDDELAKLICQAGAICVVVKDDRAELRGEALKEWKKAAADLVAGVADLLTPVEEGEDG